MTFYLCYYEVVYLLLCTCLFMYFINPLWQHVLLNIFITDFSLLFESARNDYMQVCNCRRPKANQKTAYRSGFLLIQVKYNLVILPPLKFSYFITLQ